MIRYSAILAAFVCFMGSIGAADCNEGHVHLSGPWGSAKFQVEVMDDEAERGARLDEQAAACQVFRHAVCL